MKIALKTCLGLLLALITLPAPAQTPAPAGTQLIVQEDQQVTVPTPLGRSYEEANKAFNYDWTQYSSIKANQGKVEAVNSLVNKIKNPAKLDPKQRQFAGELILKLGAFYINTGRPELALPLFEKAQAYLTTPADQATLANLIAFTHERDFATSHDLKEMPLILANTNKVIQQIFPNTKNDAVAFAWCIQGLAYNQAGDMKQAEACFTNAVGTYNALTDNFTEMSARARNKLAAILLTQPGHAREAIQLLEPAKAFWVTQTNLLETPYAARNFITLGKAYLQINETKPACDEFSRALVIYKNFYGITNLLLIEPYRLLSRCNKQLGDLNAAATYQAEIDKLKDALKGKTTGSKLKSTHATTKRQHA